MSHSFPRRRAAMFETVTAALLLTVVLGCQTKAKDRHAAVRATEPPKNAVATEPDLRAKREGFEEELKRAYPTLAPKVVATRAFDLRAAPAKLALLDGRKLDVWAYNERVPGPVLRVRLGEEVEVRFRNDLPDETTIHWHGVRVPHAMDGVPGATQDPIAPGESFTYRFVPKDAGTFWFHPHVRGAEQVERGLYGVLIVEDASPLPYSRDEVWVLDDWRLGTDGQIDSRFVTRHDLAHDGRWGQAVAVNGELAPSMKARPGERIRLRLVNTSNARVYSPDFGTLQASVIAVDGMYSNKPLPATNLELAPGNRVDLDIGIPRTARGEHAVTDRFTRRPFELAKFVISGGPVETPDFAAPSNPHVPKWQGATELDVDVTYVLDAEMGGPFGIQWTINGKPWSDHIATPLDADRWVRVRFQNDSGRLHPMHIHGQFFKVIARNGVTVDTPHFNDTVLLHGRETVDVGMVPLDWGNWMMHCHILEHAESGMMTEVSVTGPGAQSVGGGSGHR